MVFQSVGTTGARNPCLNTYDFGRGASRQYSPEHMKDLISKTMIAHLADEMEGRYQPLCRRDPFSQTPSEVGTGIRQLALTPARLCPN